MNEKVVEQRIDPKARVAIPCFHLPMFRTGWAIQEGVEKNLLIRTWGGLGDQICAEPTLRFALKTFKDCDVSLASEVPELFEHLKFKRVFNLRECEPNQLKYLTFETITPPDDTNLVWQFFSHMLVNCVDFPSMCAFRCQLPIADKEVRLCPDEDTRASVWQKMEDAKVDLHNAVVVHAGKHWQSKTFPKLWWDDVIDRLHVKGAQVILIGGTNNNRGTVDVFSEGCVDFREKLTVMQTVALLQQAKCLLTNDSAPLHMAVTGDAWIGYIATAKHPDYITHWRRGQWGYRMKNHGLDGVWNHVDYCPNKQNEVTAENLGELLEKCLPDPNSFADWAIERIHQ